jgi:copper chaperone CopZ
MTCVHCAGRVEHAIAAVEGVTAVRVDLGHKTARVEGTYDRDALVARVAAAGYDVVGEATSGDAADDAPAKNV